MATASTIVAQEACMGVGTCVSFFDSVWYWTVCSWMTKLNRSLYLCTCVCVGDAWNVVRSVTLKNNYFLTNRSFVFCILCYVFCSENAAILQKLWKLPVLIRTTRFRLHKCKNGKENSTLQQTNTRSTLSQKDARQTNVSNRNRLCSSTYQEN